MCVFVCHLSSARLANDSALNGIALCGKHAYIYLCWQHNNTDAIATVAEDTIQYESRSLDAQTLPQKLPVRLKAAGADTWLQWCTHALRAPVCVCVQTV